MNSLHPLGYHCIPNCFIFNSVFISSKIVLAQNLKSQCALQGTAAPTGNHIQFFKYFYIHPYKGNYYF